MTPASRGDHLVRVELALVLRAHRRRHDRILQRPGRRLASASRLIHRGLEGLGKVELVVAGGNGLKAVALSPAAPLLCLISQASVVAFL